MKHFYMTALVVLGLLLGGCASKQVKAPIKKSKAITHIELSKINYPNKIGDYELAQKEQLKSHNLGIMIRYIDHKKTKAYLDCYIYPKEQNSTLQSQYDDIIAALSFMHKKGELKKFSKIYEDTIMIDKTDKARRTVFDMENKNVPFYSVLYLTTLGDHYFKVRISNPHKAEFLETDYALKAVKELYKHIKLNN